MTDLTIADLDARLARIEGALQRIPPIFDPPPYDFPRWGGWGGWRPYPFPVPHPGGDPVTIDISRLTRTQLEVSLQSIKADRARLDAMEDMIHSQLKTMK